MYNKSLFDTWVPGPLVLLLTILIMAITLVAMPVYSSNIGLMVGSTGIYSEYFALATFSVLIGMAIIIPIFFRIKLRFRAKEIMVTSLIIMALMSVVTATTNSGVVVIVASLIFGMAKVFGFMDCIFIIFFIISPKGDKGRFFSIFYPFAVFLPGPFGAFIATNISYGANWQTMHWYTAGVLLLLALVCVTVMHNKRFDRKVPLYYIDWLGMLIYATTLISMGYVFAFGKQQDWFVSPRITLASVLCAVSSIALIVRELKIKRPLLLLKMYQSKKVRMGLLFLVGQGMFMAVSTILTIYTTAILGYNWVINSSLGLMILPGMVVSAFVAFHWFKNKIPIKMYMFSGFGAYFLYVVVLYFIMVPGLSIGQLYLPQILAGYGMCTLYISIWLYALDEIPGTEMFGSVSTIVMFRSFVTTGFFTALYGWLHYKFQWQSIGDMAFYFDALTMSQNPGAGSLRDVQMGAVLAANKKLLGYIIIAGMAFLALVFFYMFGRQKYMYARYRMYQSEKRRMNDSASAVAGAIT